jgi:hypothetical protein
MMLINKIGIETDDQIVELDSRRPVPDPRNRETLTMLLQVALRPVPRSQLLTPSVQPDATVSSIKAPPALGEQSAHTDVA